MSDHNRIITRTAREYLASHGFFQAGSSRLWLKDHGWFMIMAEFQPSGFSKCSSLNMGLHFLWEHGPAEDNKSISAFHYPHQSAAIRQCHAAYTGDNALFSAYIAQFCRVILAEAERLHSFLQLPRAESLLAQRAKASMWYACDHALCSFLSGCHAKGLAALTECQDLLQQRIHTLQDAGRLQEDDFSLRTLRWLAEEVSPAVASRESAHAYVLARINRRRAALSAMPKYRRMSSKEYTCELS
ncbi:MAG: hypothetical protein IJ343_08565 [Clostridia bacterium]|nr:hypothetical protein [Clostridia bacterium]